MSILRFWALNVSVALLSMLGQKALGFHQKHLNLCSEDERRSYGFEPTWRWVIHEHLHLRLRSTNDQTCLNIWYHYSTAMQFPSQTLPPLYSCMCTLACYVNHTIILQCLREDYIGFETEKNKHVYNISPWFLFIVKDMDVVALKLML